PGIEDRAAAGFGDAGRQGHIIDVDGSPRGNVKNLDFQVPTDRQLARPGTVDGEVFADADVVAGEVDGPRQGQTEVHGTVGRGIDDGLAERPGAAVVEVGHRGQ